MLGPSKIKWNKVHRKTNRGFAYKNNCITYGEFGIKALAFARITPRQLEAVRKVITRRIKGVGRQFFRVFPHTPITEKGIGTRMGKGAGKFKHFVAFVKPGNIIVEWTGLNEVDSSVMAKVAGDKLPIGVKLTKRYLI